MKKQAQEVLRWYDNMQNPVSTWYHSPQYCFCGHNCSRCVTYLAAVNNDDIVFSDTVYIHNFFTCKSVD